ncbi:unnamed protein product [Closterium sp. Naga37s-1]|nr:unnamed protein product [Closterium sp. Naga37s-1]
MHSRPDRGRDPARYNCRHAHRHSAGPADLRNQQSAVAEGTARVAPNPNDAQVTPSPASPEIAAETVARGIALGVSAGLPDHEEMGGEENGDAPGTAERPPCAVGLRDAHEMGGEERAAEEADAEASAHAPAAADRQGGLTQHVQGPTNTPARWGARQADEEELASAQSGGRARLRRDAQGHAHRSRRQHADLLGTRRIGRPWQGARERREEEEREESAWDAAASAADDAGTGEDAEVEERAAQIGAVPAQADTRELQKG